jgi:hypothetical protein
MCLTTNGAAGRQLYQWPCNLGVRQEWRGSIPKVTVGDAFHGAAPINPWSGLAMDVSGASASAAIIGSYPHCRYNQDSSYWQL